MKFENLLKKVISKDSFCVVGNAPTEIGKRKGSVINNYKTVIRFNDFSVEYSKDYGTKTDIWVRASNDKVIDTLEEKLNNNYKMIFIRAKGDSNKKSIKYLNEHSKKFEYFPPSYEALLSRKLRAIPSTGLLFLYILKENNFKLTHKNIYGFSFFDEIDLVEYGSHHYFDPDKLYLKGITMAKHNWSREKKFFQNYILGNGK